MPEEKSEQKPIGKITHYYGKLGVAIVELAASLKAGDRVEIKGGTTDFEQEASSMQIEHETVAEAKAKDVVGLKVEEKVREGDKVFLSE